MSENASSSPAMYAEVNAQRYPLRVGQFYMFGTQTSTLDDDGKRNFIRLNEKDIDEKHCCISDSGDEGAFVLDLLSKFGTFINGNRVQPLKKTLIRHGDIMRLGPMLCVKIFNDSLETSHDSSGYGEINKNISDIICSSPEATTSQRDVRLKRLNSNISVESNDKIDKFAIPAVPSTTSCRSVRISDSNEKFVKNRNSLGRRSDSFIIPETQYAKPRSSTASNMSIAESDAGGDRSKSGFNLDSFGVNGDDDDDDDFCIPETQEVVQRNPSTQQGRDKRTVNALKTLEEKSVDLKDSDEEEEGNDLEGSQFRICTQDYNEGFGEEDNESMGQSQIIPFIKHTMPFFNNSNVREQGGDEKQDNAVGNNENPAQDEDEMANVNWGPQEEQVEQPKNVPSSCSTPDLFEFGAFDSEGKVTANVAEEEGGNDDLFEDNGPATLEDAEDFMPTQMFPSRRRSSSDKEKPSEKGKLPKEKDILSGKEDEPYITLSDKENLHPDELEPVTDLPPRQLFATRDVSTDRLTASTSQTSRSLLNQNESKQSPKMSSIDITASISSKTNKSVTSVPPPNTDEEDDILTQAFPQPSKPSNPTTLSKNTCFNSTLLDEKSMDKNPAAFFADMEKTPNKKTPNNLEAFKMPEIGAFTSVKKTSSVASSASNATVSSDLDLLMCTPQLIKDHLQFSNKPDDLRKNILAAKNKNLFGNDDSDENEDTEDDTNSKDKCLVQLINVPKDSKDFDQLLPHLRKEESVAVPTKQTNEQKSANEAYKQYQFNISFGRDQENGKISVKKSSVQSRDERHSARDKERESAARDKRTRKIEDTNVDVKIKRTRRRGRNDEAENDPEAKGDGIQNDEKKEKQIKDSSQEENKEKSKSKQKQKDGAENEKTNKKNEENVDNVTEQSKEANMKNEENEEKSAEKKLDNSEEQESNTRTRRGRKRKVSTETKEESKESSSKSSKEKLVVRVTRLHSRSSDSKEMPAKVRTRNSITPVQSSASEQKASETKSKKNSNSAESITVTSKSPAVESCMVVDEVDLIPTQPLRRNTRKSSRHKPLPPEDDTSSTVKRPVSRSSSSNRSMNRSNSRLNESNNALPSESTEKSTKAVSKSTEERKRKVNDLASTIVQPEVEGKRLRRTISSDSKSSSKSSSSMPSRCLISTTMVDPLKFKELFESANGIWAVAKDPNDSSILVMDKAYRTFKFLLAMARGIPIVTSDWLQKVNEMKSLKKVQIQNYLFKDPAFEKKHKFSFVNSLKMAKENKIFQGLQFIMTGKIQPQPIEIKAIIESAGGCVLSAPPANINEDQKMYLVSSVEDRKEWHKFRRINKNIIIISTEAIMTSVMRQNSAALSNYVIS